MNKFKESEINIMTEFKESINKIITDQDAKIYKKIEEELQPMSLQIKDISSKHSNQAKQLSTHENRPENISNNNKISTKFGASRTENEDYFKMQFDKFKTKASSSIYTKMFNLNSNKYTSSYDQPSADIIKWPLLKSAYFHSHE